MKLAQDILPFRPKRAWLLAMLLFCGVGRELRAQDAKADPHPLIERVTYNGITAISRPELQATLSTQPTRCRAFFLKPFCLIIRNHIFEAFQHLDHEELRRDVLRIKVFYWLRGYRHAQVDTVVVPKGRGVAVTFNIKENEPTVVKTVSVHQTRDTLPERRLIRWGLLKEGDPIDLTRLDSLRLRVRRSLWDMGHGNAEVRDTAHVLDSLHVALDVLIDAGPITTVDTVLVEGNKKVTPRTVRRIIGLRHGDLYKRGDLLEAQRRLYRSDLFRQSIVVARDSADSAKKVVVTVREAGLHAFQVGGGVNNVEFGQVQGNLTLYNFKGTARRVELHSAVGNLMAKSLYGKTFFGSSVPGGITGKPDAAFLSPTWQLSASMTQPWVYSRNNSLGITAFSNRRSIPGIVIDRGTGASLTFTRTLRPDLTASLSYRYEKSRIEAGDLYFCVSFGYCRFPTIQALQQSHSLSPLIFSGRADRTDDPLEPTRGYTARVDVEHGSGMTGSDWRFNRFEVDVTPYLKLGQRVLVIRGHLGRVSGIAGGGIANGGDATDTGILLHPRTRFYGGGARSVRGYAEGQLGPRVLTIDPDKLLKPDTARGAACTLASIADASCDPNVASSLDFTPRPVGGHSIWETTIEYRFRFGRNLGAALFVDAGRVGSSRAGELLKGRSAITPGAGFRYRSPIGPVRIDVGIRPNRVEDLPVMTQTMGADSTLRLVQLRIPKHYNPGENPTGFFGKLASRTQLHIYIGEAY